MFVEHRLPKKIISDMGTDFVSENANNAARSWILSKVEVIIMQPPEQWPCRGMYEVHQEDNE